MVRPSQAKGFPSASVPVSVYAERCRVGLRTFDKLAAYDGKSRLHALVETEEVPQCFLSSGDGSEGVFVLVPPDFDPSPDFREARAAARSDCARVTG